MSEPSPTTTPCETRPSTIDTPRNRQDMPQADPRRWVSPESIAGVIQFLLSDAARDISGALVPVYARA